MSSQGFVLTQEKATDLFIQNISSGSYTFQVWDEYLDSFPVPTLLCDHTLVISEVNEAFLNQSGFRAETVKGIHFRNLPVSLVSGESVWDAALTGRSAIGIGEVMFPNGPAFYEIRSIPLMPDAGSSPVMLVFFVKPEKIREFPSYDTIRASLSESLEVMAETDGTILSMSPGVSRMVPSEVLSGGNILDWDVLWLLADSITALKSLPREGIRHYTGEVRDNDVVLLVSVRLHEVVSLKRDVLHLTIVQIPGSQPEQKVEGLPVEHSSFIEDLTTHISQGDFSFRIDPETTTEQEMPHIISFNVMMEQIEEQYTALSDGIAQMKSGWIPSSIQAAKEGPFSDIINNLNTALDSLQLMIATVESFTMSVMEGDLTVKGDTAGLSGYYLAMVSGMNQMLERLNTPLLEMRRVALEYASCRFSSRMEESIAYPGDFAVMKESMDAIGIYCAGVVGEIDRVSGRYAEGDFSAHLSRRLEVTGDFLTIRDSLDNIGVQVSQSITSLRVAADVLSQEALGIKQEIASVSGQSETLAAYTGMVSDRARSVQDEVSEMVVSADTAIQALSDMNEKVLEVANTSARTHELSGRGVTLAMQSREGIDAISEAAGSVDNGITRIHEELIRIGKIIRVVTGIANQTNLLAINAAIEAAHAGSYGKGFAVVASEVKNLAVQSKESTTNISDTLEALHDAFLEVKEKVSEVQGEIESRGYAICEMVNLFEEMIREVELIAAMSRDTGVLTGHQQTRIEDLHRRAGNIGDLMVQTAHDADDSAKACFSSCSSIEEMSVHIETVARYAEEIHKGISGFTV